MSCQCMTAVIISNFRETSGSQQMASRRTFSRVRPASSSGGYLSTGRSVRRRHGRAPKHPGSGRCRRDRRCHRYRTGRIHGERHGHDGRHHHRKPVRIAIRRRPARDIQDRQQHRFRHDRRRLDRNADLIFGRSRKWHHGFSRRRHDSEHHRCRVSVRRPAWHKRRPDDPECRFRRESDRHLQAGRCRAGHELCAPGRLHFRRISRRHDQRCRWRQFRPGHNRRYDL